MVRAKQLIGSLKPSRHVRIFPFVELRMTYLSLFLIPSTLCLITPLFTIICLIECLITCFHYRMTTTSSFYLSPIWCIYRGLRATFNTTHESSFSDLIFRSTPFPSLQPVIKILQRPPRHTKLSRATLQVRYRWIFIPQSRRQSQNLRPRSKSLGN